MVWRYFVVGLLVVGGVILFGRLVVHLVRLRGDDW